MSLWSLLLAGAVTLVSWWMVASGAQEVFLVLVDAGAGSGLRTS
jgi:hypothetical protein